MASNPTQKDIQLISDAVIDGNMDVNNLPQAAQVALANHWNSAGFDVTKDFDETSAAQYQALRQEREARAGGGFFDSPIFKPIEWVGSKLYAAYSATVSPILSAGGMALHSIAYGRPDYIGEDGEWDALQDYWDLGHKVSPGQAAWMMGLNNKELKDRGISPDQIAQDKDLVAKGEYQDNKTPEDPFGIRTRADEYFGSGASKYATGATDFAVSWYLDPLILAGKGAGATKRVLINKPVTPAIEKMSKKFGEAEAFNKFAEKPAFQKMVDTVMNVKTKSPDTAPITLRRDMPTLSKSANGDALARLLGQAKDADEVSDILRVSMGDTAGKAALEVRNVKLGDQVNQLTARNVAHGSYYDALDDATKASPRGQKIKAALDQQTQYVTRLNTESRIIDDKIDAFRSIDAMNFNRVTTPLGMKVRGSEGVQSGGFKQVRGQGMIRGTGNLVYNSTIGAPIKLVRSYSDIKPTMYIDVHGENSYKELDASLRETKSLSREAREMYVSRYIKASPNERQVALVQIEQQITRNMVDRYNLKNPNKQIDYEIGLDMYKEVARRRSSGQAAAAQSGRSYGSATMPDPMNPAQTIRVAEIEADGSRLVSTPIFDTQLANSHVLLDFNLFEKALNANASKWQATRLKVGDGWTKATDVADFVSTTWKFAQLFRLGYAPRALADDFLGQLARFGGTAMMGRAMSGGKITAEDMFRNVFKKGDVDAARINVARAEQQIAEYGSMQAGIKADLLRAQAKGDPAAVQRLQDDLDDITSDIAGVQREHADYQRLSAAGQQMRDVKIGRQVFAPAFGGKQGELYRDLAAGDRNFKNLMGSQADFYLKRMRRLEWKNISPATDGAEQHMAAWLRHTNDQIGQSAVGRQVLAGKNENEIAQWMRNTPEGQKYRNDIGLKSMPDLELAQRVKAQVDYVLDPAIPGMDIARTAILQGKLEKEMLEVVPMANRPMVNAEAFRYAEGTSTVSQLLDKSISGWYNIANQIPARKLLRNPLFGQSYKNHLSESMATMKAQGVTHIDESTRKILESNARKGALDDVKKYTFTMDHETKMAYMMRHFGAFFGAQQESWNRWGRIIADKPDVLARVGQAYGAPARAGVVTDQDGNVVDASGHVTDPDGVKRLIKYSDRKMVVQVPDYLGGEELNKVLGLDKEASFVVPMSSAEIILNHGDGALPVGAGPFVQIGVNHFAKEDPKVADWAKKLGVLPFGPQDSVMDFINPNTGKRLGDANDDMGETKQRSLFYMMQVENYKYENGLRDTQPTWKELKDRADRWTMFRTAAAWTLPLSVNGQDPYQFFRDEFQRYQKLDSDSADEKFYDKYGDSFYAFTQSMSKNNSGLRPTAESVKMSQYYKDLIEKVGPEYAGLIVGHEGDGVYSEGAYFYQKHHAADVASNVTQRTNMSAREAWEQTQKSRGWMQYRSYMDKLNSELFDMGLNTFDDEGAEDLKDTKQALIKVLTSQRLPDGKENPFYNEAWEKDYNSMDRGRYDRTAFDLEKIVQDPELWGKAVGADGTVGVRSDIYTLKTYLEYRKQMAVTLAARDAAGGSADITTQANYDLKNSWDDMVMKLIESDTKFSWIHSRYFATDMGFNMDVKYSEEQQQAMEASEETLIGQEAVETDDMPNMFDVMSMNGE